MSPFAACVPRWTASLSVDVSRLLRYGVEPFPAAALIEYTGKITGGRGRCTQWRGITSLTLVQGPWSGSYGIRQIGSAKDINAAPADIGATAPAVKYHNVRLKYALCKA